MHEPGDIAALIGAAITKKTHDRSFLLRVSAACWPGRDDRTVPIARRWVESWGPQTMSLAPHACTGPCATCN